MLPLHIIIFIAGLLLLFYGAEHLVSGCVSLSKKFQISQVVVGMTVLAFATSMPELMVSLAATAKGSSDLAAGNIIGSNVTNLGLVLGAAAFMTPVVIADIIFVREIPVMIASSALLFLMALNGHIGAIEGGFLFASLLVYIAWAIHTGREQGSKVLVADDFTRWTAMKIVLGLLGLAIGAEMMVRSSLTIAQWMGVSELVVGIVAVAFGTSLPELAATLVSAYRGNIDLSVGNVIGSNIFNILFVLGICPIVTPVTINPDVLNFVIPAMLIFTIGIVPLVWVGRKKKRLQLGRIKGLCLLAGYVVFLINVIN